MSTNQPKLTHAWVSGVGFLLLNNSLKLLYASADAIKMLSYGEGSQNRGLLDDSVSKKIRALLHNPTTARQSLPLIEFTAGKRLYRCRIFSLQSPQNRSFAAKVALLIERNHHPCAGLPHLTEQFRLTEREQQVVEFLLLGLTNKEIAQRMKISPNTVRAFLRLVMVKMGVSNRVGIIREVFQAPLSNARGPCK